MQYEGSSDGSNTGLDNFIHSLAQYPCYHYDYVRKYYYDCLEPNQLRSPENSYQSRCRLLVNGFECIIRNVQQHENQKCSDDDMLTSLEHHKEVIWWTFKINATECIETVFGTKAMSNSQSSSSPVTSSALPLLIGCAAGALVAVFMLLAIILTHRKLQRNRQNGEGGSSIPRSRLLERPRVPSNKLHNIYKPTPVMVHHDNGATIHDNLLHGNEDEIEQISVDDIYTEIKETDDYNHTYQTLNGGGDLTTNDNTSDSMEGFLTDTSYYGNSTDMETHTGHCIVIENRTYMDNCELYEADNDYESLTSS